MITQAIKDWLHKMFAWWPWKQSTPLEYQHVASGVSSAATPETSLWISEDGTFPQAGATPRRFTLESRAERLAQPRAEAPEVSPFALPAALRTGADSEEEFEKNAPGTPTSLQRLEFLRYLVQHGIVNEGFESDPRHPSS